MAEPSAGSIAADSANAQRSSPAVELSLGMAVITFEAVPAVPEMTAALSCPSTVEEQEQAHSRKAPPVVMDATDPLSPAAVRDEDQIRVSAATKNVTPLLSPILQTQEAAETSEHSEVAHSRHSSPVPVYDILPVLGFGLSSASEALRDRTVPPAPAEAPASHSLPGASAEPQQPAAGLTKPDAPMERTDDVQIPVTVRPANFSPGASEPAATAEELPGAERQAEAVREAAVDAAGGMHRAEEAPRLMLPGSKAAQKRARQAAAAQARQHQQQLPAKRSWEDWLQTGVSLTLLHC